MSDEKKAEFPIDKVKRFENALRVISHTASTSPNGETIALANIVSIVGEVLSGYKVTLHPTGGLRVSDEVYVEPEFSRTSNVPCAHDYAMYDVYKAALQLIADDHVDSFSTPASARRNIAHAALDGCYVFKDGVGTIKYRPAAEETVMRCGPGENYND